MYLNALVAYISRESCSYEFGALVAEGARGSRIYCQLFDAQETLREKCAVL